MLLIPEEIEHTSAYCWRLVWLNRVPFQVLRSSSIWSDLTRRSLHLASVAR